MPSSNWPYAPSVVSAVRFHNSHSEVDGWVSTLGKAVDLQMMWWTFMLSLMAARSAASSVEERMDDVPTDEGVTCPEASG
jgi:hypothetical protein